MTSWTPEQVRDWYDKQPFLCGFNYVPSTAVNSTEMWQSDTFDPVTIERELGWAAAIGFNTCRVFLQELVFTADPEGFLTRLDTFLRFADAKGISTMPILFDDCAFAGKEPYLGTQLEPTPGVHNSQWTPCPSPARATNPAEWSTLQEYVTAVVSRFRSDKRVLVWDVYNEPGNNGLNDRTMPLVEAACGWMRDAAPSQPLTVAAWDVSSTEINARLIALSDVVSFHNYDTLPGLQQIAERLQKTERPLLCTEWMARTLGSRFDTHLPFLQSERIGSWQWGLVRGRTQTYMPWGSVEGAPQPETWFHDILYADGTPYYPTEIASIKASLGTSNRKESEKKKE